MDRVDFFFGQPVTEAELDLAFQLAEDADRNFALDIGVVGIADGLVVSEQGPPALSVDVTDGAAYDDLGRRLKAAAAFEVDLSQDSNGLPSEPALGGNERWISIFVRFIRVETEERTDDNNQQIWWRQSESHEVIVRLGAEAGSGLATRPSLVSGEVLLADALRLSGQTTFVDADLDFTRRQSIQTFDANEIRVDSSGWSTIAPAADDVQASLDDVDDELTTIIAGVGALWSDIVWLSGADLTISANWFDLSNNGVFLIDGKVVTVTGPGELPVQPYTADQDFWIFYDKTGGDLQMADTIATQPDGKDYLLLYHVSTDGSGFASSINVDMRKQQDATDRRLDILIGRDPNTDAALPEAHFDTLGEAIDYVGLVAAASREFVPGNTKTALAFTGKAFRILVIGDTTETLHPYKLPDGVVVEGVAGYGSVGGDTQPTVKWAGSFASALFTNRTDNADVDGVTIRNLDFQSLAAGSQDGTDVYLWAQDDGDVANVLIENVKVRGEHSGLLKFYPASGAIEDQIYTDIVVRNVHESDAYNGAVSMWTNLNVNQFAANRVHIENVTVLYHASAGVADTDAPHAFYLPNSQRCAVINCKGDSAPARWIDVGASFHFRASGNDLFGAKANSFWDAGGNYQIVSGNIFRNANTAATAGDQPAIVISGDNAIVIGNVAESNGGGASVNHGIRLGSGSTYCVVTGNWVEDAVTDAGTGGNNVVHNNAVNGAGVGAGNDFIPLLRSSTVAGVPATGAAGQMIYVTDETGGAVPAFWDGSNWRRVTDRAVVS